MFTEIDDDDEVMYFGINPRLLSGEFVRITFHEDGSETVKQCPSPFGNVGSSKTKSQKRAEERRRLSLLKKERRRNKRDRKRRVSSDRRDEIHDGATPSAPSAPAPPASEA